MINLKHYIVLALLYCVMPVASITASAMNEDTVPVVINNDIIEVDNMSNYRIEQKRAYGETFFVLVDGSGKPIQFIQR